MYDLKKVFNTIIKQGFKGDAVNKTGTSFLVRDKSHFTSNGVVGFMCGSQAALQLNANSCTHWTPNLYMYGEYTSDKRKYIKGHTESNLRQINSFVIDIDTKEYGFGEIILHSVDAGLGEPCLIVESDKGYHVYFTLTKPIYISAATDFKSLKIAKRISTNLKSCFSSIGSDVYCNDFGFFRIPNNSNIVWFNEFNSKSMSFFINWSQSYDDSLNRTFRVLSGNKSSVNSTTWIRDLLANKDIKGAKGQFGRNNIIFTLSLSCMESGISEDRCFDIVDEFNSNLNNSLATTQIIKIIRSAYSGKYKGANQRHISDFYETYTSKTYTTHSDTSHWYKFKKSREERTRSHYDEWELDINTVLYNLTSDSKARYVQMSQNELCELVGISRSTLNVIINHSKSIVKRTIGKGRNAVTLWSTVSILLDHCLRSKSEKAHRYDDYINNVIDEFLIDLYDNPASKITLQTLLSIPLSEESSKGLSLLI